MKIAARLEQFDKTSSPLPPGLHVGRAAAYGGLAGLGAYGGQKVLAALSGAPDPSEMGGSALGTAGTTAAGGAAIASLLNFLNKLTRR